MRSQHTDRELAAALFAELAAVEPARRCCRVAERAGLGAAARGRARTPAVGRLAVRLESGAGDGEFSWAGAAAHCRTAYVRGLLLAHGSLSVGPAGSHLELVLPLGSAARLAEEMAAFGFPCGLRERRGRGVLTWKGTDAVIALLRRAGASAATLELESRLVARSLGGHLNRVVNAEHANLERSVAAARRQLEHIESIEAHAAMRRLPARARRVAQARRRAPEATFSELAESLGLSRGQLQRAFSEIESVALQVGAG